MNELKSSKGHIFDYVKILLYILADRFQKEKRPFGFLLLFFF